MAEGRQFHGVHGRRHHLGQRAGRTPESAQQRALLLGEGPDDDGEQRGAGRVGAARAAPPTPAATPTKTATPTPVLKAKFTEKPDEVVTGNDARFEVETSADKGTCVLYFTYKSKPEAAVVQVDIDNGKCDMKYNVPKDTKTGQAKARALIASKDATEGQVSIEDDFDVKAGDSVLAGDIDVEVEGDNLPNEVNVGEQVKIAVKSNVKKSGRCEMTIAWPKYTSVAGENQTPDGDGRCSWTVTVPVEIPKKGNATLTVVVRKSTKATSTEYRVLTYDFDVKK